MKYKLTILSISGLIFLIISLILFLLGVEDAWSDFIYLLSIPVIIGIFVLDYIIQALTYYSKKTKSKFK